MSPHDSDVAAAVTRLEGQVRRLKIALGAIVFVAGAASLTAWTLPQGDMVTARQFMVLDADGIPRGNFGVLADGASVGMMFSDFAGNARVEMRVDPDGSPRVAIMDDQQRVRAELGMRDDGSPNIIMADPSETARVALSVTNEGSAQLLFIGPDGSTRRAVMGIVEDGRPVIVLSDEAGETIFQAPDGAAAAAPADTTGLR